jgi:cyclopropane-fatty-acyl-phospholipid synthase
MAWYKNFDDNWHKFKDQYGERFYRMWKYYMLASAGAFRSRDLQLWQIVLSKHGVDGVYNRIS